jgi:sulfur carrier protein ThiS
MIENRVWRTLVLVLVVMMMSITSVGGAAAQAPDDGMDGDLFTRMAETLGMTREALLQTLLEGQTLREVAEAQDVEPRHLLPRPATGGRRPFAGGAPVPPEAGLEMLAKALDMTPAALKEAREAGTSLTELIESEGLDPEVVAAEIKAEAVARIEAAAAEGDLPEARAEAMIERLETSDWIERWVAGELQGPPRLVVVEKTFRFMAEALADLLGMTPEALRDALREGQTAAALIEAQGLTPEEVAATLQTETIARIKQAVEDGDLTESQGDALVAHVEDAEVIEDWLAGERPGLLRKLGIARKAMGWLRRHPRMRRLVRPGRVPRR